MSNLNNNKPSPTIIGVGSDIVGLGSKLVSGSFKLLAFGVAKAHNAVDFAVEASQEGYIAGKANKHPQQLELNLDSPKSES